jgi:hypothetical protein
MKKTIIALTVFAALSFFSFNAFADEYYNNMPNYADGYDKGHPTAEVTAEFTAKPAIEHTAKGLLSLPGAFRCGTTSTSKAIYKVLPVTARA